MRRAIAALRVSLDGFIEGPNGEMDWVMEDDENWFEDAAAVAALPVRDVILDGELTWASGPVAYDQPAREVVRAS